MTGTPIGSMNACRTAGKLNCRERKMSLENWLLVGGIPGLWFMGPGLLEVAVRLGIACAAGVDCPLSFPGKR